MDYSKYVNTKTFPSDVYNEKKELKQLKSLVSLSPAQSLRIKELEQIIQDYKSKEIEYNQEKNRIYNLWKNDMYNEYEVIDNPKVDQAFQLAWDYGHAYGYQEIEYYFSDLVRLIKE